MATCKDCLHYEPCFEYGNILDPAHGGVKCDSFKSSADVVEVVRCKDCNLRDTEGCPMMYWECGVLLGFTEDNHFCSYGERKEPE